MNLRKALITGITGQDGSYLAELLLAQGYEVHGIARSSGMTGGSFGRIAHLLNRIHVHTAEFENHNRLCEVIRQVRPQECYHLAAQTFVSYGFEDESRTLNTNINGTHVLLAALREHAPECRFCFAGSSEMFGRVETVPQDEDTRFHPRNAYGVSKVAGFDLVRTYRETHSTFACTAILFNHESPRRGANFVTRKVTRGVAAIAAGKSSELVLGSLDSQRDWGHARDYVRAMWLMMQHNRPDDYVIATGKVRTVKSFVELAFSMCGLRAEEYVRQDPALLRPSEGYLLCGNSGKAAAVLGWHPQISFEDMVREMVEADCLEMGVSIRAGASGQVARA